MDPNRVLAPTLDELVNCLTWSSRTTAMSPRCSISIEPTSDQCSIVATSTSTNRAAASTVTDAYLPKVRSNPSVMVEP